MFLDLSDIYITYSSTKLSHCYLRPYIIEKQVGFISYYFKLFFTLQKLYLVFSVVKLSATSNDLISRRYSNTLLNSVIINREKKSRKDFKYLLML